MYYASLYYYTLFMLRTKNLITNINEVPTPWIFEYYLKLNETLTGQDVNMKSIFSNKDDKPSMFIFYSKSERNYFWKDFSSGLYGNATELVRLINNLEFHHEASALIMKDYRDYCFNNNLIARDPINVKARYQVAGFTLRNWTIDDKIYWTQFGIGSSILNHYNVKPLRNFKIKRDDQTSEITIKNKNIYGYFTKDGNLYKIYQPLNPDYKFFKIADYIQGSDQLSGTVPYLIICSSLKDLMAFKALGFKNVDVIAPDSENVTIPLTAIDSYKQTYQSICTLFDNDDAGKIAMTKYTNLYSIPSVLINCEKDIAESVKVHGLNNVREIVQPRLSKTLKENSKK